MIKYEDLDAVHMDDLSRLLDKCGILKDFRNNKLKCKFCREVVTESNIYSVMRDSGNYKLICDKVDCASKLLDNLNGKKERRIG